VRGLPCGKDSVHLARYVRAYRRGLISQEELAAICDALPMVSAGHLVAPVPAVPG
jgi:hypothetical protein